MQLIISVLLSLVHPAAALADNTSLVVVADRGPAAASAAPVPVILDEKDEAEVAQKVRSRSYPGGSDESDLKVQSLLQKPTRKISPTAEEVPDSATQD